MANDIGVFEAEVPWNEALFVYVIGIRVECPGLGTARRHDTASRSLNKSNEFWLPRK